MGHKTYGAALVAAAALAAGQLAGWSNAAPAQPSAAAVAQDRLTADATHGLRLSRGIGAALKLYVKKGSKWVKVAGEPRPARAARTS